MFESFPLVLAQTDAPPAPETSQPIQSVPGTTSAPGAPASPPASPPSLLGQWFLPLLLVAFVVMMILPGRKEKKRRQQMMASLKRNDRVMTTGGVIGTIVEVKPDVVVLKVDESSNTRITFSLAAIQTILTDKSE